MTTPTTPTNPARPATDSRLPAQPVGGLVGARVLLVAPMGREPGSRWIFPNLVPSLRRLCGRVHVCPLGESMGNWHIPSWPSLRRRLMERVLSEARGLAKGPGLDLVLTVLFDDSIDPGDVRALRDLGVRVATYHLDMNAQWYRVLRHAPELDLLAISHMQHMEPLLRRGVPMHFMPMGASPDRYLNAPVREGLEAPGVLMLGSATPSRVRAVAACRERAERVDVYGGCWDALMSPGGGALGTPATEVHPLSKRLIEIRHYLLPRLMAEGSGVLGRMRERSVPMDQATMTAAARATFHGPARDKDVAWLMASARIVLGVNQRRGDIGDRFGFADSRLRDFEAPLSGAFYLVQSFVDLPLFYRPGSEVETWSTLDELRDKVGYYADRPEARRAIAAAGRERAARDHTWDARLSALLHRLGLPHRAGPEACPLEVTANLSYSDWCADSDGCAPSNPERTGRPELPALIGSA